MTNQSRAIVEKSKEGRYFIYLPDCQSSPINGDGATLQEAKDSLFSCIDDITAIYKEEEIEIPEELLKKEFNYKYDIASFLEHFSWINASELSRIIGINPSLMRAYKSRNNFASENQLKKIQDGIKTLTKELENACLV